MDQAERTETAQQALVYVGIAVAVVVILVLLWYAIDVVLLAFIGVLVAILLRAPADWLSRRLKSRKAGRLPRSASSCSPCSSPAARFSNAAWPCRRLRSLTASPRSSRPSSASWRRRRLAHACLRSPSPAACSRRRWAVHRPWPRSYRLHVRRGRQRAHRAFFRGVHGGAAGPTSTGFSSSCRASAASARAR